jgi:adenosine kinase
MASVTKLFCIGNPLLDVSADVDQALLDKYDVKLNNAILAEDKHLPVFEELVEKYKVQYIAGGATQNSARVAQWQVNVPGAVTYTGCIGKDSFGEKLKEAAKKDGLTTPYYEIDTTPTGKCAVLVLGTERSLIAHLAAAEKYQISWTQTPAIQSAIASAGIFYIAGFVLTHSADSILHVAKHAADNNKIFCMNTSAPFLFQVPPFFNAFKETWEYIDILFGNESEAEAMVSERRLAAHLSASLSLPFDPSLGCCSSLRDYVRQVKRKSYRNRWR